MKGTGPGLQQRPNGVQDPLRRVRDAESGHVLRHLRLTGGVMEDAAADLEEGLGRSVLLRQEDGGSHY